MQIEKSEVNIDQAFLIMDSLDAVLRAVVGEPPLRGLIVLTAVLRGMADLLHGIRKGMLLHEGNSPSVLAIIARIDGLVPRDGPFATARPFRTEGGKPV